MKLPTGLGLYVKIVMLVVVITLNEVDCLAPTPWQASIETIRNADEFFICCEDLWTRIDLVMAIRSDSAQKEEIARELLKSIELIKGSIGVLYEPGMPGYVQNQEIDVVRDRMNEALVVINDMQANFEIAFKDCAGWHCQQIRIGFQEIQECLRKKFGSSVDA